MVVLLVLLALSAAAQTYRYEAEAGQLFGTTVRSNFAGYSGAGFVTGFDGSGGYPQGDYFQIEADVPAGLYELWVGYRSPFGMKGYNYFVDGEAGSGFFDASNTFSADRAGLFAVGAGTNTFGVAQNWGYYDIDYVEFRPFTPPPLAPVSPQLIDAQADLHTRQLMGYLVDNYGKSTLSGQQVIVGQGGAFPNDSYLQRSGGLVPAVRTSDLIEYSPSRIQHGSNPNQETEKTIAWARQTGGVVSMSWHWNAPTDLINTQENPWWRGFYTDASTFDLPAALADPQGADYQLLLRDIDAIADELQKFEDAGVPVIFRPLHEAQGGWFWWGAHGPDTFKQLWGLVYDRITEEHEIHNLIWEFTSSAAEGDHLAWYPGDDLVDMIGLDIYTDPSSSMSGAWYDILEHYNGNKMIALSETGTLPSAELMELWGVNWSYFSPWTGSEFEGSFSAEQLQATLGAENIITLDELPTLPWAAAALPGDFNLDGAVDAADYTVWRDGLGTLFNTGDYDVWRNSFGAAARATIGSQGVPEPPAWALSTFVLACLSPLATAHRVGQPVPTD